MDLSATGKDLAGKSTGQGPGYGPPASAVASECFRISNDAIGDGAALRDRLKEDGYLFFKAGIPADEVAAVRAVALGALVALGWVSGPEDSTPANGFTTCEGEPSFWSGAEAVLRQPELHALPRSAHVKKLLDPIFDEPYFCQPRSMPRIVFPRIQTSCHQDMPYVQGSIDTLTSWIPLGACSRLEGSLEVLKGSQATGLRKLLGGSRDGCASTNVDEASSDWRGADFDAGDVLVFTCLTVHRARPNRSPQVRLTIDSRYQPAASEICKSVLEPAFTPYVPGWSELLPASSADVFTIPEGVKVRPIVDPQVFVPPAAGRVFPWLRS
jgi:phytanoyl-CoA dioxygenase PhyH